VTSSEYVHGAAVSGHANNTVRSTTLPKLLSATLPRAVRIMTSKPLLTIEHSDPHADVLVVTSGWPNEDNETYCVFIERQVASLVERGLRCDVLFIRGYRSPLAYPMAALRLFSWSLRRKRLSYRLVHAHSGEAALAAIFYWRAPLLVSYLGSDVLGRPRLDGSVSFLERLRRTVFRQLSRLTDRTITKSREMQMILPSSARSRNVIVPNGVDVKLFRPIDRRLARRELGWNAQDRIVLFAADPKVPRKRFWLAKAAVDRASLTLSDLQLEIARGVMPDRIPVLMNGADCLLLTSSIEGSPNVVKEALMCNLPVVATAVGDVDELLDGVEPSYICEASETVLARALIDCLSQPRRSNGRSVSPRLDASRVAVSLLTLYREIVPAIEFTDDVDDCVDPTTLTPAPSRSSS
jgi:glycosyltransferase involved in cell wall biosynthesis